MLIRIIFYLGLPPHIPTEKFNVGPTFRVNCYLEIMIRDNGRLVMSDIRRTYGGYMADVRRTYGKHTPNMRQKWLRTYGEHKPLLCDISISHCYRDKD